jgi:hypothetical protein
MISWTMAWSKAPSDFAIAIVATPFPMTQQGPEHGGFLFIGFSCFAGLSQGGYVV